MAERLLQLDDGAGGLFAVLHQPAGTPRTALVICQPLLEEQKAARRTLVEAARALAAIGCASLIVDYAGCADSPGEFDEYGPADWVRNIRLARGWLARESGVPPGLLGLRFGATLAALAAEEEPDLPFLVLWEPVLSGKAWLASDMRRLLVRDMMARGRAAESRDDLAARLRQEGRLDFSGHAMSVRAFDAISALDLAATPKTARAALLVLQIGPAAEPSGPMRDLAARYPASSERQVLACRAPTFWNLVGIVDATEVIRTTTAWLAARPLPA